jgi:DNA polymerase III sliding clamp (beta) subunit (PCNA family)
MIINKSNLDISKFVGRDKTRPAINGIRFTETGTVATDAFRLIEVAAPKYDTDMIPDIDKVPALDVSPVTATVPVTITEQIKKQIGKGKTLPVSAFAGVSLKDREVELKTINDDLNHTSQKGCTIDGDYPDYKQIIPKPADATNTVLINAQYLRDVADYFIKYSVNKRIKMTTHGETRAVMFEGETEHGQAILALVMPIQQP